MKIEIKDIIYINKRSNWLMLLTLFFVLFSSCNNDNVPRGGSESDKTATVRLTFTALSQQTTRALSSNESTVNDITVLIFNSNGDVIGSNYQTFTTSPYSMTVTTRFANNCTIYAIANTGSSSYFSGVSTLTAFKAKYTTLTTAANLGAGSSVIMFGKSTGTVNITTAIQNIGSIPLTRLCTKLNFTITPASGITITGYRLYNVPISSYISDDNLTDANDSIHYNPKGTYLNFDSVATGAGAGIAISNTYYMYENRVGRKNTISATARNSANAPKYATYLQVYAKTSVWHSVYRIYLGGLNGFNYANYTIPRNYNYTYNITINWMGQLDVRVTSTVDVAPQIGGYYYSDGTWGTSANPTGASVIGIIFSTTTSTADQAKGWTHGYAMAVTNAQSAGNVTWSTNSTTEFGSQISTIALMESDLDGYSHCQTIKNKAGSSLSTNYPAFYYGLNYGTSSIGGTTYAAPSSSSGWYLPSEGQWYLVLKNLGGITWAIENITTTSDGGNSGTWNNQVNSTYPSVIASENINNYLNKVTGSDKVICTLGVVDSWFWSSSESTSARACDVSFDLKGILYLDNPSKSILDTRCKIRSAIAF